MPRLALVVFSMVVVAGCNERNAEFCVNGASANGAACIDAPTGTGDHCTATTGCTADPMFPICDTAKTGGTCVQCTTDKHDRCQGPTPRCDTDTEACVACVDDTDCGGTGVCLPTGGCADPAKTIHAVSMNGSNNMNTCGAVGAASACDLDTALAIAKMGLGKNVIKLDDAGPYKSMMNNYIVDVDTAVGLTIDARIATVHPNGSGPIFTINDNKAMTIIGGTIEGAMGSGGDDIRCGMNSSLTVYGTVLRMSDESAIDASGCTVTVTNAVIRDNSKAVGSGPFAGIEASKGSVTISRSQLISNRGGGIIVVSNGKFVVVGNAFLSNGDVTTAAGGVSFTTSNPGNRLEFNTFAENKASAGVGAGIQCLVAGFTAQNNIVWNNNGSNGVQVGGNCVHAYSDIGPLPVPTLPINLDGNNNLSVDPKFVNPTSDLRLGAMTTLHGTANPQADLSDIASKDLAGKPRVTPADPGAYNAPPLQ